MYKRLNKLVLLEHGKAHLTCIARSGDGAVVPGHVIICLQMLMYCKHNKVCKCRNTGCLVTGCIVKSFEQIKGNEMGEPCVTRDKINA